MAGGEIWPELFAWCESELGSAPAVELFKAGHLGEVRGIELADGRRVVVKLRPADKRVGCAVVIQRRLYQGGFPCPEPLGGPCWLGDQMVTAEALVMGDRLEGPPPVAESAGLLAELVALAGDAGAVPELSPPWVAWDHPGPGLWLVADDLDVDLNHPSGPTWLEGAAARVRARLADDRSRPVIGHCDWEAYNFGWRHGHVAVVYDWDSLGVRTEAAMAGTAATVVACRPGGPVAATTEETEAFLAVYRRGCPDWDAQATEMAYAAGLWVLLYNARKELAGDGRVPRPPQ